MLDKLAVNEDTLPLECGRDAYVFDNLEGAGWKPEQRPVGRLWLLGGCRFLIHLNQPIKLCTLGHNLLASRDSQGLETKHQFST